MNSPRAPKPHWQSLFSNRGFRFYFGAMFVSLFGTGMNFAGVTLYVLAKTHSTVQVSFTVILLTLPRLLVPPVGGVLTDRVDRRYLSIVLDLGRAAIVMCAALLAWRARLELWELYGMVLLLGVGFAIYWSASLALLQEVIPPAQLVSANSAVLIAVQGGMLAAGALVGLVYEHTGLAGILGIDGATYIVSALCFYLLRTGYSPPQVSPSTALFSSADFGARHAARFPGLTGVLADLHEGLTYLRTQPTIFALGLTYACMMAGVISANVLVVALANNLLHVGARGYGFIESGWAFGAVAGGFAAAPLSRRHPMQVLLAALLLLAVGHAVFPYAGYLAAAILMNAVFGACRAIGAVLTQSSILGSVPSRLMGRTQSAFAFMATVLQVVMSFALGWLAEHASLQLAFLLLGAIYGAALIAALRVRTLNAVPATEPTTA
ncbi:MAG TPA: MFS transporter [Candidatus Acidoferrales bacterium]|nr:MFS transporter [Candidatus Acidoferrales bacterium]